MKLQFKTQQYQTQAVEAVVDVFSGQPYADGVKYRIDPGKGEALLVGDAGLRNADVSLTEQQLLTNVHAVQRGRGLALAKGLVASPAAPINLDVEMETGTGKTYVYIKTIMELHKRYGWSKYIVVVPSIAIREGVKKSFDITAEHFQQLYGTKPRTFIYNSSRLHEVERFSSDAGVQVMIINIQAFNAAADAEKRAAEGKRTSDVARRIFRELDDFQSRRPIDVIAANRPILIIDEPQRIEGDGKRPSKSLESLREFNAPFALRYSATHKIERTKVHRLDALDAYNQKLVKKIAVRGITVRGLAGSSAYLYVDGLELGKGADFPKARIELEVQTKAGPIVRKAMRVQKGSRLHDLSGEIEAYKDLVVIDVDANRDIIELSNGDVISAGQITHDVTDEAKRRLQIREVIRAHLDKERELFGQGVKVLSLFFIDEVAKYRDYAREDTLGDYARVFEEEYEALLADHLQQLDFDEAAEHYRKYVEAIPVPKTHEGYFSIDKKTGRRVDGAIKKTGESAGQSDDVDAYDLILKHKELLLSFGHPVRFIWSHSALREGWDNPNVFVMGMLKKSDNTTTRRQEIGRGLRLCVDQHGERMDNPATVHDINELTVVTDESYTSFVTALQKEIVESLSARPRKATPEFFAGKLLQDATTGEEVTITVDQAKQLQYWLTVNGLIDYDQHLTDKWLDRAGIDLPPMPAGLEPYHYQVAELIDSLNVAVPQPTDGRKPKRIPLNDDNFAKKEFQELWGRINRKAVYQVEFDSDELIRNCVRELDSALNVTVMQYVVQKGVQLEALEAEQLEAGAGFKVSSTKVETSAISAGSTVKYDLLGEIAEKTKLTRKSCAAILTGVRPTTFAKFKANPEQFITEAARLINEQKAAVIVQHLSYDLLDERFDSSIFTENQTAQDLSKAGDKLKKSIYEYVVTDSKVERDFVTELDTSDEVVVYSKLPRGFFIPTPVGDYNPDWAIAFREGTVKHVYFVAETKGSLSSLQLKGVEEAKIECARRFFESVNKKTEAVGVVYDVVDSYSSLLQLVGV
jgi:type III restriction enzyme